MYEPTLSQECCNEHNPNIHELELYKLDYMDDKSELYPLKFIVYTTKFRNNSEHRVTRLLSAFGLPKGCRLMSRLTGRHETRTKKSSVVLRDGVLCTEISRRRVYGEKIHISARTFPGEAQLREFSGENGARGAKENRLTV